MAIEHVFSGETVWRPTPAKAADQLGVNAKHMRTFEDMLSCAGAVYKPAFIAGEVRIEALGDDFAYVSGEWLEGAFLANTLAAAQKAYVFVAEAGTAGLTADNAIEASWSTGLSELACMEAVERLTEAIPRSRGEDLRMLTPLSGHGWPDAWTESIFRLLDTGRENREEPHHHSLPGFVLVLKPTHSCQTHCPGGNCGECTAAKMQ